MKVRNKNTKIWVKRNNYFLINNNNLHLENNIYGISNFIDDNIIVLVLRWVQILIHKEAVDNR
jgi:hypothetical protein